MTVNEIPKPIADAIDSILDCADRHEMVTPGVRALEKALLPLLAVLHASERVVAELPETHPPGLAALRRAVSACHLTAPLPPAPTAPSSPVTCLGRGEPVKAWIGVPPPGWKPGMRPPCLSCGAEAESPCAGEFAASLAPLERAVVRWFARWRPGVRQRQWAIDNGLTEAGLGLRAALTTYGRNVVDVLSGEADPAVVACAKALTSTMRAGLAWFAHMVGKPPAAKTIRALYDHSMITNPTPQARCTDLGKAAMDVLRKKAKK